MADDHPLELAAPRIDPASLSHIELPPQLVEAVQDDPELLTHLTRGQLAVVQDKMVRSYLADPNATISQGALVHERLSKNARLVPETEGQQRGAAQVVINIIREGAPEKNVTITAAAEPLPLPDDTPQAA